MSDCPRTDAARISAYGEGGIDGSIGFSAIPVCFARQLERELTAARAEAEALRKDAERYRWLRETVYAGINRHNECLWSIRGLYEKDGQSFDAAIDAARKVERSEKEG